MSTDNKGEIKEPILLSLGDHVPIDPGFFNAF
jgi:hypothetical protein